LIASSLLFRDVGPQEFLTMAARFQTVRYPQNTNIIERGVWHGYLYIIVSGSVNVLFQEGNNSSSPEIVLATLQPGECFGEMSLITGESPEATVRTGQDTVLWSLSHLDFMFLTAAHPILLHNMNQILAIRLARTNQQVYSTRNSECVWLDLLPSGGADALMQRSLAFHIAHALAERSHKRVCLLEMCDREQAVGPRFATHPDRCAQTWLRVLSRTASYKGIGPLPPAQVGSIFPLWRSSVMDRAASSRRNFSCDKSHRPGAWHLL
jgi:CRP-like cAMP-binding protein